MRTAVVASVICGSIVGLAVAEDVRAAVRKPIDIPPQPLGSALKTLATERGFQILFLSSVVGDARTEGARGELTPGEALGQLLTGTGLSFKYLDESTVAISGPDSAPAAAPAAPKAAGAVDEVVVVGSRLARPTEDGPVPVTVISREKIDALGVTTIGDALRYLPQQSFNTVYNMNGGAQRVQLRGLGVGTTLVLVNGRRAVPGAVGSSGGSFDLNSIPLSTVERIEVLADSGSAIYGADAVGGVVNIVLKTNVDHPTVDLSYGGASGGADERRASVSFGGQGERAGGLVVLDYFKRGALFGRDRDITASQDFRRFPGGVDLRSPRSNPGNVCAVSGNLPGLSTPCAAVPAGSTGVGLTPASFLATAGQQNLESLYTNNAYVNPAENYGALMSGTYRFSANVAAFGEFVFSDRSNKVYWEDNTLSNVRVSASNPYNPFGVPVLVSFALDGYRPTDYYQERTYRAVTGLRGPLASWDWELSLVGSSSRAATQQKNYTNTTLRDAALAATSPAAALNVFRDGSGIDDPVTQSILYPTRELFSYSSRAYQANGFLRGTAFDLPAGPVKVVAGVEARSEAMSIVGHQSTLRVGSDDANRKVYAGYTEARVPVLGHVTGIPLVHDVDLTLAGRYDHYSDFGGTFNANYGLEWRPRQTLLVRGSYGESYRAPDLYSLYQPLINFPNRTIADPRRNNETATYSYVQGGNPNLGPEISTASSFGTVWTPDMPGMPHFGASFWHVRQSSRLVGGVSGNVFLANELYLPPGKITRAEPTAEDIAAGLPGKLLFVDYRLVNLGRLDTKGVDLDASASFRTSLGTWSPRLAATHTTRYASQDFVTSPVVRRVGIASVAGTVPDWKAVGSLSWELGGVALTGTARYVSGYDDATNANVPNKLSVASQTLFDLQFSLVFDELPGDRAHLARGLTLRAGAVNLFDQGPRYSQITVNGFDPSQADIRQRYLYVSLSQGF
ncbi:MAG: TonB-dependent receptor [Gammaproteobacteria bacterium]